MLYFRAKKCPNNGTTPKKQKEPVQFEGGGEKEKVAGGRKGAGKGSKSIRRRHEKKSARGRGLVSCSGTLFLLNDNVVDKLFSF